MLLKRIILALECCAIIGLISCDLTDELRGNAFVCKSSSLHQNDTRPGWFLLTLEQEDIRFEGDPSDCRDPNYNFFEEENYLLSLSIQEYRVKSE